MRPEEEFDPFVPPIMNVSVKRIAEESPELISELQNFDPLQTAAAFAGLLTSPDLQANCIRLEALVHLATTYCMGREAPTAEFIRRSFDLIGRGSCGIMEDPAEDNFVSLVNTPRGNFRIFNGVVEGASFYLQRILNLVETMPEVGIFKRIRDSVGCLLKLSDSAAERAGVIENALGREMPLAALPDEFEDGLSRVGRIICFSEGELLNLGITKELLKEFVFSPDNSSELRAQILGHSGLERHPLALDDAFVYLLLPTAVAPAITRMVIESVVSVGKAGVFEMALADEYGLLFYDGSIMHRRLPSPIHFQRIAAGGIAAAVTAVDPGRFLHLIFLLDGLTGFGRSGLVGTNDRAESFSKAIGVHLRQASEEVKNRERFLSAITLVVGCGFGRTLNFDLESKLPDNWRLEAIGAHDLVSLNWLAEFDALSLWRVLDAREALERQGTVLVNMSGLINLIALSRELGGHLVPHQSLPSNFVEPGKQNIVVVRQNAVRGLRHIMMTALNPRRVLDQDGRWVKVMKLDKSLFEEENRAPLYGSEDDVHAGKLRAVYVAPKRAWWLEIAAPEGTSRELVACRSEFVTMDAA